MRGSTLYSSKSAWPRPAGSYRLLSCEMTQSSSKKDQPSPKTMCSKRDDYHGVVPYVWDLEAKREYKLRKRGTRTLSHLSLGKHPARQVKIKDGSQPCHYVPAKTPNGPLHSLNGGWFYRTCKRTYQQLCRFSGTLPVTDEEIQRRHCQCGGYNKIGYETIYTQPNGTCLPVV